MNIQSFIRKKISEKKMSNSNYANEARLLAMEDEKKRLELKKKVSDEQKKIGDLKREVEPSTFQRVQKVAARLQARRDPRLQDGGISDKRLKKITKKAKEEKKSIGRGFGSAPSDSFGLGGNSPFKK